MRDFNNPGDIIDVRDDTNLGEGITANIVDAIGLELEVIRSITTTASINLDDDHGDISPSVLSSMLYGVGTHLGAIAALVDHAFKTCPRAQEIVNREQQEAHREILKQGGIANPSKEDLEWLAQERKKNGGEA